MRVGALVPAGHSAGTYGVPHRVGGMADERYDFVIVGGGSAGSALANRLSADPSTKVLVLEAGRPDWKCDMFIHMPAALTIPIGSRFYDWKYESEPEPLMNGRRVYHARGKVLGGSSSINGMIFQRGNPMDYERWARRPGHGGLGLRALPAVLQEDGDVPRRRRRVARRAPARSCSSAARRRARCSRRSSRRARGRLSADEGRQRLPAGGLRALRPQHPQRPALQRRRGLPAPGDGPPEPRRPDRRDGRQGPVRRDARDRRGVLEVRPARQREGRRPTR